MRAMRSVSMRAMRSVSMRAGTASHLVPVVVGRGMSDVTGRFDAREARWLGGGVLAIALGLLILLWPGPLSITDRLPFGLLFLLPGAFAVYHAYAEANSPV